MEMKAEGATPELSIVIVNWNSAADVAVCLESLAAVAPSLRYETVVVDNASTDDSIRVLEGFSNIRLVRLSQNVGFARANNIGVEHSKAPTLLLLNPDTKVLPGALETMHRSLYSSDKVGAVGCKLLNRDLSIQTSCIQPFPTVLNQLLAMEWLRVRTYRWAMWGIRPLFDEAMAPLPPVEVISGACIMVKRAAFEGVGGFSTNYFMYGEDVDLCHALWKAGWRLGYVKDASIIHFGGQSTKKRVAGFSIVVMRESVFQFLKKTRGSGYALLYRSTLGLSSLFRIFFSSLMWILDRERMSDALHKWFKILRWSVGLEAWVKELKVAWKDSVVVEVRG